MCTKVNKLETESSVISYFLTFKKNLFSKKKLVSKTCTGFDKTDKTIADIVVA